MSTFLKKMLKHYIINNLLKAKLDYENYQLRDEYYNIISYFIKIHFLENLENS